MDWRSWWDTLVLRLRCDHWWELRGTRLHCIKCGLERGED